MDQLVSASAVAGHALMIDCRSLQSKPFAVPSGSTVVIMDTNTRGPLVGSAYAERRENCERVAAALGVQALRDADLDRLPDALVTERRRARHVITENRRTLGGWSAIGFWCVLFVGRARLSGRWFGVGWARVFCVMMPRHFVGRPVGPGVAGRGGCFT